jgi:hypothetical protein
LAAPLPEPHQTWAYPSSKWPRLSSPASTPMPACAKPPFRQRLCRTLDCRALFFICSYCDRGQVYCSESCRHPARHHQRRQANRRHQQTLRGRLAHSRRQRNYRIRLARARHGHSENKVTDHSSQARLLVPPSRRAFSSYWITTIFWLPLSTFSAVSALVVCQFCGRLGRFVNTS